MSDSLGELLALDPTPKPRPRKRRPRKPSCDYCRKTATSETPPFGWGVRWHPSSASQWRWCDEHVYIAAEIVEDWT